MFGKNYPKRGRKERFEAGAWRIEVQPAKKQARDYMLHVFYVTDASDTTPAPKALGIESAGAMGVQTCGWTVIFPKKEGAGRLSFIPPKSTAASSRVLFTGLKPGATVSISSGKSQTAGEGGCVAVDLSLSPGKPISAR